VLGLAAGDPVLGEPISSESSDIYAQVLYSVMEEGARTLSDIVLRRMHLGMTASRGLKQAEKIADKAGRELKWSDDERRHQIDEFAKALSKETACLGGPERKRAL
jgi:glycerol-3-phosphate dehydrogenase